MICCCYRRVRTTTKVIEYRYHRHIPVRKRRNFLMFLLRTSKQVSSFFFSDNDSVGRLKVPFITYRKYWVEILPSKYQQNDEWLDNNLLWEGCSVKASIKTIPPRLQHIVSLEKSYQNELFTTYFHEFAKNRITNITFLMTPNCVFFKSIKTIDEVIKEYLFFS